MVFSAVSHAARRRAKPAFTKLNQRRGFALGGSSGPPPDWQGVDKVVRGYFPQDYQLSIAILGFYSFLGLTYKIKSAMSKKPVVEEAPAAKVEASTTGVPDIDSPAFEKFLETSAFEKLLENEDQLNKLLA